MTEENNFPTVRTGSLWLLTLCVTLVGAILYKASDLLVDALKAVLTALGSTHLILVGGKSFIKSKWSSNAPDIEETTTVRKTTAKATDTTLPDVNIKADNVNVN